MPKLLALALLLISFSACSHAPTLPPGNPQLSFPGETRIQNLRQMTFGGTNAEAYWSFDGRWLSYQHKGSGTAGPQCDQIFRMSADGKTNAMVSNGKGRTTCSFYFPDNSRILYSSTFAASPECPPTPDMSKGYVWPVYNTYQIYSTPANGAPGADTFQTEPGAPTAYNAEATVCHDGSVVFTSDRDGDLDLYTAKLDQFGTLQGIKRVTNLPGYDGGAFFSPDCQQLVWRASRPRPGKELDEYQGLLSKNLIKPGELELWIARADGSHAHQVTRMGVASFAPFFTPDAKKIIFASNPRDPRGRSFDLYMINVNGTGLERVTYSNTFESFPMFSPDGKYLAFSSNRNAKQPHETNVFIADWNGSDAAAAHQPNPLSENANPADRFYEIVRRLSAPENEGRGVETRGIGIAANFIESRFRDIELKPFFETFPKARSGGSGYRQQIQIKFTEKKQVHTVPGENIIATWGSACGRTQPVVIGAHYDHLGFGSSASLEPDQKGLHPGADDNASGIAGIMEAARILRKNFASLEKSSCFIFAAFTGEEVGIAGSSRFVELLKSIHVQPKAMLNLDMVGRMEKNTLTIFGTDSAREWKKIVADECGKLRLNCPGGGDGYGPSDHMLFYIAHVPVLHFFTGPHLDYHRTTDTADKINATGGVQAAEAVATIAARAARPGQSFQYRKAQVASKMGAIHGAHGEGHGAYLGTIPDYSTLSSPSGPGGAGLPDGGIRLVGARPGSPADKAGIREGDILFVIDTTENDRIVSHKIGTLNDFMDVLVQLKPGDKATLGVKREGKILKLPATVGKRTN